MPDHGRYVKNIDNHLGYPVVSEEDIMQAQYINHTKQYDLEDGNYYCKMTGGDIRHATVNFGNGFITRMECYGGPELPYIVWHYERDSWRIYREWPYEGIPREEKPFDMGRCRERCGI
jgi:hypothetical protein